MEYNIRTCQGSYFVSGSQDRTCKIWKLPNCDLQATLTGHSSSIFGVDINVEQTIVATGSADKTIRLWRVNNGLCFKTIYTNTNDYVMSVSLQNDYLACAFGVHVMIYKLNFTSSNLCTVQKIMETQEHRSRYKTLQNKPSSYRLLYLIYYYSSVESVQLSVQNGDDTREMCLISAGKDGLIKYWNLKTNQSLHTFSVHNDTTINCVYFDHARIITAGDDCAVRILNFMPSSLSSLAFNSNNVFRYFSM
ncbi:unnamed protein product [Didymodactylos carnosus]|uniref:Uncharacterized protein n=2 Tax=Didymodactylos carnosus TaxID=1234261 RepID=A0A8S2GEY2_9BILA|nr:unnamed protein product [Didymodactylos carnosus]CAF3506469.1 unnamed protein product [Didymodactylos carnosus]